MKTKIEVKVYCVQAEGKCLQHGLRSVMVRGVQVSPGLPALHVGQPPPAQVCGGLGLVRAPSPPQLPCKHNSDYCENYHHHHRHHWYGKIIVRYISTKKYL